MEVDHRRWWYCNDLSRLSAENRRAVEGTLSYQMAALGDSLRDLGRELLATLDPVRRFFRDVGLVWRWAVYQAEQHHTNVNKSQGARPPA